MERVILMSPQMPCSIGATSNITREAVWALYKLIKNTALWAIIN